MHTEASVPGCSGRSGALTRPESLQKRSRAMLNTLPTDEVGQYITSVRSFLRVGMKTTGVLARCVLTLFPRIIRYGLEELTGAWCVKARDPSEEISSIARSNV